MFDNGTGCEDWVQCDDNQYTMLDDNMCADCGENCLSCDSEANGECMECAEGLVKGQNKMDCVEPGSECTAYGPVDDPAGCTTWWSEDRLIEPYDSSETHVDWRDWGIVNPIRNQESCGSCWAFMSTANAETNYAIHFGTLHQLSEQHLVSCDPYNLGCQGGWPTDAYRFWQEEGTIDLADYPYTNDEAACYQEDVENRVFYPTGYVNTQGYSAAEFKASLREYPLGVAFGVANEFYYYFSGVYTGECEAGVNHGMVAVGFGYDDEEGLDYAIVRNSWGTNWGEDGYIRVQLGDEEAGGHCMMMAYPNYPSMV